MTKLNESLEYMDLKDQMSNIMTVDEYAAKMGKDNEIVTLTFETYAKLAAQDLTSWFERGYDFVLDASVSQGELEPGKYLVFVEMLRRTKAPFNIIELLSDLQTLTDFELEDWIIKINEVEYPADAQALLKGMVTNPNVYAAEQKNEETKAELDKEALKGLNECRSLANLPVESVYTEDTAIRNLKNIAGL